MAVVLKQAAMVQTPEPPVQQKHESLGVAKCHKSKGHSTSTQSKDLRIHNMSTYLLRSLISFTRPEHGSERSLSEHTQTLTKTGTTEVLGNNRNPVLTWGPS